MCHANLLPDLWELPFLADYTVASMQAEQVLGYGCCPGDRTGVYKH